jgi:hypothetical protein
MISLLKLKHWQLFLILLLLPAIQINNIVDFILWWVWLILFVGWIFSIGFIAFKKLTIEKKINCLYFKISTLITIAISIILSYIFSDVFLLKHDFYEKYIDSLAIVIPLQSCLLFSLLYQFYFSAKMLASVSKGKLADYKQWLPFFFSFWLFPIGIWFIQPKVNRFL